MDQKLIETFANQILDCKRIEKRQKLIRETAEEQLANLLEHPDDGSKTHTVGNFKITIKGVINTRLDKKIWLNVSHHVPPELAIVTYEPTLSKPGIKWLMEHRPDIFKNIASAITTKPGKTAVEIKAIEND